MSVTHHYIRLSLLKTYQEVEGAFLSSTVGETHEFVFCFTATLIFFSVKGKQ